MTKRIFRNRDMSYTFIEALTDSVRKGHIQKDEVIEFLEVQDIKCDDFERTLQSLAYKKSIVLDSMYRKFYKKIYINIFDVEDYFGIDHYKMYQLQEYNLIDVDKKDFEYNIDILLKYHKEELIEIYDKFKMLIDKLEKAKWLITGLRAENERLSELNRTRSLIKNERNAGRKNKFDNNKINEILKARQEGKSIRTIAKEFGCSIGLIHKLINEHN